jgi:transcriptional regulator with XRE-family HTH domain
MIVRAEGVAIPLCTISSDFVQAQKTDNRLTPPVRRLSYIYDMEDRPPNNLRAWRKFRRMTQQELADELGTAKSVISDLERGVVQLNDKWLRRLAPVLKTQPGHILDYAPEDVDTDIIDIWSHIGADDREAARRMLQGLRQKTGTND